MTKRHNDKSFLVLVGLVFLVFLLRQFFLLLEVDLITSESTGVSVLMYLTLVLLAIAVAMVGVYYVPTLLVIEILTMPRITLPRIEWGLVRECLRGFVQTNRVVDRNLMHCQYRC